MVGAMLGRLERYQDALPELRRAVALSATDVSSWIISARRCGTYIT